MPKPVRKAIFPVGGLGTRFLPATKAMPKEMLPVVDKPLIQYALEEAQSAGIEEFIFVTGRGKSVIEDHFDHATELQDVLVARNKSEELRAVESCILEPGRIVYIRQQEPLGLGHAVWCARNLVHDEPVAVLLPDDLILSETPCLTQMIEAYAAAGGNLAAVMDVPRDQTDRYGILDVVREEGRLCEARGLVEKPAPDEAPSTLSIIGRYILEPEVFAELDRQEAGAGGEIQLTDAMARAIPRVPFRGYRFEGRRFDCGNKAGFLEANIAYALARDDLADEVAAILREFASPSGTAGRA